jgi:hypothetical protein
MNIKSKLILATAAFALLSAPASARIDGDEGGASAYPRFHSERAYTDDAASAFASGNVVRPRAAVRQPQRPHNGQPWR